MTLRATAAYLRYSSHAQDDSTSVELQREAIRRAAGGGGDCLEYLDQARTGRAIAGRTALRNLLDDAEAGRLSKLYVYKYDRLGRDLAEAALIVRQLEDAGVEVISCTEGNDPLARGMHMVISEHYSRVLSERTRAGQLERHRQGAWTGGPAPYGYTSERSDGAARLVIDEQAAELVRWIFGRYVNGWGMKRIAADLNRRGLPSPRGQFWSHSTVHAMLHNEIYVGRLAFGRRRAVLNRATGRRRFVANEPVIVELPELRIVSQEVWTAVKDLQAKKFRGGKPRGRGQLRPLTGLAFCPVCHSKLWVQASRNAKGLYYYLECSRRRTCGEVACSNSGRVREDHVVGDMLRRLNLMVNLEGRVLDAAQTIALQMAAARHGNVDASRAQLAELQRKSQRVAEIVTDDSLDADGRRLLMQQMGDIERQRRTLQEQVERAAATSGDLAVQIVAGIREALGLLRSGLGQPDGERMNEMIRLMAGEIEVLQDGSWRPKRPASPSEDGEASQTRLVAGAGFEPATFGL